MKRKILVASVLIIVCCITGLLWLQQSDQKDQIDYTTSVILPNEENKSFMVFGKTFLAEETHLLPSVDGLVTSVTVRPGDHVKQGQVLATLDVDMVELRHIETLYKLRAKSVETNKIEPYLKKISQLEKNDQLSFVEASRLKTELLQMVNQQLSYQSSIDERLKQFQGKVILAPFDGIVRDVRMKLGHRFSIKDDAKLGGVYMTPANSDYMVELEVTDELMSFLNIGQKITVNIPMANLSDIQGEITAIPHISYEDKKKRYFSVTARLKEKPVGYFSGMRIQAQISSPTLPGAIWVPKAAFDLHLDESKVVKVISYVQDAKKELSSRSIASTENFKDDQKVMTESSLGKKTANEVFPTESSQSEIYVLSADKKVIKASVMRGIESKNFVAVYAPGLIGSNVIIHYQHRNELQ